MWRWSRKEGSQSLLECLHEKGIDELVFVLVGWLVYGRSMDDLKATSTVIVLCYAMLIVMSYSPRTQLYYCIFIASSSSQPS